ncbi:MAG: YdeI/OmpD-associated family protein [Rhodothermales bacterium]
MIISDTFFAPTRADWRAWLEANHATAAEIWLVTYVKRAGTPSVSYNDAVEEALCFGWIDSIRKGLDADRHAQRFSPRKKGSGYSQTNRERMARLLAAGRLMPALAAEAERLAQEPFVAPPDILEALRAEPAAWAFFQSTSPAYQRIRIAYVDHARPRPGGEFEKRLAHLVAMSAKGKQFGNNIESYY